MTTDDKDLVERLLPCPFCGTDAPMSGSMKTKGATGWWIECRDCPALIEEDSEALAIAAWNTRPEAADRIEQLSSALRAVEQTTFIGVTATSEETIRVALESAHDIANSALQSLQVGGE
jgi:Lar family restriction alleviation protein